MFCMVAVKSTICSENNSLYSISSVSSVNFIMDANKEEYKVVHTSRGKATVFVGAI